MAPVAPPPPLNSGLNLKRRQSLCGSTGVTVPYGVDNSAQVQRMASFPTVRVTSGQNSYAER